MPTVDIGPADPDILTVVGPNMDVHIGFDPNYRAGPGLVPSLPPNHYSALIDTGARDSCIDSALASALNLVVIDQRWIAGVGGPQLVNVYAAQLYVPSLNWIVFGDFHGVHLTAGQQPHFALIGRTFLRHHTLFYDGRSGVVRLGND